MKEPTVADIEEDKADYMCKMCGTLTKHTSPLGNYCPKCEDKLYNSLSAL